MCHDVVSRHEFVGTWRNGLLAVRVVLGTLSGRLEFGEDLGLRFTKLLIEEGDCFLVSCGEIDVVFLHDNCRRM